MQTTIPQIEINPFIQECFTDNGEHSHWELHDLTTGKTLWSDAKIDEIVNPRCNSCGGKQTLIRGRYPKTESRLICPTCAYERLEQINDISSPHYGKTYTNSEK